MDYARFLPEHHLDVKREGRVVVVTLTRPESRNAVDHAMHLGLEQLWRPLGTDPDVGAIVLTGAGSAFCAGGDIGGFGGPDIGPIDQLRGVRYLVQEIVGCEAPLIAAVNGPASGLGATLALLCDVIYMADSARIGDTHVKMGMVAGDGGAVIWPALIGPHRAKELLMSGRMISGPEAAAMGLVNHCVPADSLMDTALEYARELAAGPQVAIRWTKMAINRLLKQNLEQVLDFGVAAEHLSIQTEDCREAMTAFVEKRKPAFKGR